MSKDFKQRLAVAKIAGRYQEAQGQYEVWAERRAAIEARLRSPGYVPSPAEKRQFIECCKMMASLDNTMKSASNVLDAHNLAEEIKSEAQAMKSMTEAFKQAAKVQTPTERDVVRMRQYKAKMDTAQHTMDSLRKSVPTADYEAEFQALLASQSIGLLSPSSSALPASVASDVQINLPAVARRR